MAPRPPDEASQALARAPAELIRTREIAGAAAHRCGYATTSAFSASFKERFGLTPRQHVARVQADSAHHLYWR